MDWTLELIVVPTADIDRAKRFYLDQAGFELLVDVNPGGRFRVVQLTPRGSACAIALMLKEESAGTLEGLHLAVPDIKAARAELVGRGAEVSNFFHFPDGQQTPGLDPERRSYGSFFSFADPDGNGWLVQEVKRPAKAG
ncbi:VOC family protein [Kitasatospora aureofaciens]|uniref:VOC family protein n=1 Tax=Kitasatospora aureofaciens TaxID=1894 RepID=UPI001C4570D9|nr:VOC family protein [Kitasatospora aureofaciens]MBV6702743.1 VOC family protein [Kitasatospora aureofaciens]